MPLAWPRQQWQLHIFALLNLICENQIILTDVDGLIKIQAAVTCRVESLGPLIQP